MRIILFLFCIINFCLAEGLITPLNKPEFSEQKAELGKKLFFDTRLSKSGNVSCETCHRLYWEFTGTTSNFPQPNKTINPISVLNAAASYIFFADGKAHDIAKQVEISITSKQELNSNKEFILKQLSNNPEYRTAFKKIYGTEPTYHDVIDAIVNFEKAILPINSRFDKFLRGDKNALNKKELKGYHLFVSIGCVACHNGRNLGSNFYAKYPIFLGQSKDANFGKYNLSKKEEDRYFVKVPSLRNILRTNPYMYEGSINNLKVLIKKIAKTQLDIDLTPTQVDLIYAFLGTLNGEKPRILNEK